MKILVVGGGGREHAIVWKIAQSPKVEKIYCAPGNGGIADLAECVDIGSCDIENMVKFAKENAIDLVMVAPDDPLVLGMVDAMEKEGIRAFGPRANAAIIEGSKSFSKDLMKKYISRQQAMRYSRTARRRLNTSKRAHSRQLSRLTDLHSARVL
jgi:phosphoribosylamine--glycine ligase